MTSDTLHITRVTERTRRAYNTNDFSHPTHHVCDSENALCWQTIPGFGEGSIPGFSNSGRAVVLIKSAQLAGASVHDLRHSGVTCTKLPADMPQD
jgi:hypothetical protein